MNVSGISAACMQSGQIGMSQETDALSRDLQNQIQNLQKQLKEISANTEMPMETKMKKRQEIQKQISDLEIQLRQHQAEVRQEGRQKKQQKTEQPIDELSGAGEQSRNRQKGKQNAGLSQASMQAMISADAAMEQAGVQGSVASKMEGRAGVLEIEIKLDTSRGGNPEAKREELAKVKEIADKASASQMQTLGEAGKKLDEAAASDTYGEDEEEEENKTQEDKTEQNNEASPDTTDTPYYVPVDVRV